MTSKLAQHWPYHAGLEYSPPARGTWTIAHTPLLVPESYEVYVCPQSCLRGVSLSAAEFDGLGSRFSLIVVEEADLYRSRLEDLFVEGVSDLLCQKRETEGKFPPIVFLFGACIHEFQGTDMNFVFRSLRERFPDVIFAEGSMNCTLRTTALHYEAATNRALYKGLLPGPKDPKAVNVIGNYFALNGRCEVVELLQRNGYTVRDLPNVKTFEEYQSMAEASLNFYTHPFGKAACEDLEKRLGTPFFEVPYCWDFEEIESAETSLLAAAGLSDTDLSAYRNEADEALRSTAKELSGWEIRLDAAATPRPFGLADLLASYGFRVTTVYADTCAPSETAAKKAWEAEAALSGYTAEALPLIDFRMRCAPRSEGLPSGDSVLALGQKAAFYSATEHFTDLIYQSGLLGYRGITILCEQMKEAAAHARNTKDVLSVKAIGSFEKVAEGKARKEQSAALSETVPANRPKPLKQAALKAVNCSSDLSGVCSALFELGGLVVMHDASGCNSTYATHDEPRWYESDSLVFISGLREYDAVLGNDEKYISDVCEAAEETKPNFIAVFGAPIADMTGTDFKGVARVIEKRTGIPTLAFRTNGMHTYQSGMRQAFRALAERFVNEQPAPEADDASSLSVNLLGLTPLDFSIVGNAEALQAWCAENCFHIVSSWAMGSPLEEISRAGEADVNLVLSSTALDAAQVLQKRFGTPYVVGLPVGKEACAQVSDLLKEAALTGENKILWKNEPRPAEKSGRTLIIGEPVFAASLRRVLEETDPSADIRIVCPLEDGCGCLRDTDLLAWDEPTMKAELAAANRVIADPLYRNLLPNDWTGEFADWPVENYSGRMYRDRIPVFLGPKFEL